MFDPRSPYHRRMWHYESDRPLSVAQLVALGSLDAPTAALLWLLIERHQSLIVSGPTDPTPGVGKTTTLNALLGFLPAGSTLVYTTGMYEDFDFESEVQPETTCVLANEVSDHLTIYMWGHKARKLLRLPGSGYAIATSCHADTVTDVLAMLKHDLRLAPADISRLGVIVNIGLVGRLWPPRRRFLTVNLLRPAATVREAAAADGDPGSNFGVRLLPLSTWDETADSFVPPDAQALDELAGVIGLPLDSLQAMLQRRADCISALADGRGVGVHAFQQAVHELTAAEQIAQPPQATEPGDS
jgi:hypothetical protein